MLCFQAPEPALLLLLLDTNLCVVNTVQQRVKWRNKLSLPLSPDKPRMVARTEASICLTHSQVLYELMDDDCENNFDIKHKITKYYKDSSEFRYLNNISP